MHKPLHYGATPYPLSNQLNSAHVSGSNPELHPFNVSAKVVTLRPIYLWTTGRVV